MAEPTPNWQDLNENIKAKRSASFEAAFEEADKEKTQENATAGAAPENGPEIDPRETEILNNLNAARSQFASTEYSDRSRMERIRKYFNMREDKTESPNIAAARDSYQASLREHLNYQIDKLQKVDANGNKLEGMALEAEVKKLYSFYNLNEATEYYDSRTKAKMDHLASGQNKDGNDKGFAENAWDKFRLKSAQVSEWYSKRPAYIKLGLAAASFIPGASAFALGKRTWGAAMMMAAGGMQLDKFAQMADRRSDRKEGNKEYKNISLENGDIDFDRLKNLLDGKIEDIDERLNAKNVRSGVNKFIAFSSAIFLGATTVKGMMDLAEGKTLASTNLLGKLFAQKAETIGDTADVAEAPVAGKVPDSGTMYGPDNAEIPSTNAFEHGQSGTTGGLHTNIEDGNKWSTNAFEHGNATTHETQAVKTLTIEKGSSIERTLIDHIKKIHPEMKKDAGHMAHRMWLDYMDDNKADIIKRVGDSEYQKMLKDGMVNVKPGTTMIIDEHNPLKFKLDNIDGKISHLRGHGGVNIETPKPPIEPQDAPAPAGNDEFSGNEVYDPTQNQLKTARTYLRGIDKTLAADHAANGSFNPDGSYKADFVPTDEMMSASAERLKTVNAINEMMSQHGTFKTGMRYALKELTAGAGIFNKHEYWQQLKDMPYNQAVKDPKAGKALMKLFQQYSDQNVLGKEAISLNDRHETVGQWLGRVVYKASKIKNDMKINGPDYQLAA